MSQALRRQHGGMLSMEFHDVMHQMGFEEIKSPSCYCFCAFKHPSVRGIRFYAPAGLSYSQMAEDFAEQLANYTGQMISIKAPVRILARPNDAGRGL